MSCLSAFSNKGFKNKQKSMIGAPQPTTSGDPHNPWEEETRKIQQAMGATLMLPSIAPMPSSIQTQADQDTLHATVPSTVATPAGQAESSHRHIEKEPWRQAPPLPGWEAVEWNEKGFATKYEYVGDEVRKEYDAEADDFELTTPIRKSPAVPHRLREQAKHKSRERLGQTPQISPINFSRPLPPSGERRVVTTKQEEATLRTSSCASSLDTVSSRVLGHNPCAPPARTSVPRSPRQSQRCLSGNSVRVGSLPAPPVPPKFKSRLGSTGNQIGAPPALDNPDTAMRRSRDLLHTVHDLSNRLLRQAEKQSHDDSQSLLPSMAKSLTRAMRSAYAMWRVLHSIKYDADMVYVRDTDLLFDLAAHLEGMVARIVPPKQTGSTNSATVAAELDDYVKILFRLGARLMLATGLGKNVLAEGWEEMKEKSQLEALRSGLEKTAMSVEMKVDGRLHRETGKEW